MTLMRLFILTGILLGLSACGGSVELTCDEVRIYQLAGQSKRVAAPDDLDELDSLKEMPLPEASPQPVRPAGSPCLDRPPDVKLGE